MHGSLTTFLDAADGAANVMERARLILRLSRRFEAIAPAGLAGAARVANYKSGKIIILADNGAVATKLRQMSQRLCDELSKGGAECNGIEVKVQPHQTPNQSRTSTVKPLSAKTCGALAATADGLPEGGLRNALKYLLDHAARRE